MGAPCLAVFARHGRCGTFQSKVVERLVPRSRRSGQTCGTPAEDTGFTRQSGDGAVACHAGRHDGPCGEQPASTASSLAPKPQKPEPKRSELTAGRRQEKSASSQAPECYIYTMSTPSANKTFGIG